MTMVVYELHSGRGFATRMSVSATLERAKKDAEERLQGYRASAEADPDQWDDCALVERLTWFLTPWQFGPLKRMTEDKPRWAAYVSDNPQDIFTIKTVEVLT